MKKSNQMIAGLALLASLSGSDLNAQQSMSGSAAAQDVQQVHPRFQTHNAGVGLGQSGEQQAGEGRQQTLSGAAMFQDGVTLQPRFHTPTNAGVNVGLGSIPSDSQQGDGQGRRDFISGTRGQPLPDDNLAGDIIVGTPFAVYAGPSANNPVLLIDAGIVPDVGARVIMLAPSLPDGMNTYFRNGNVIICVKGEDDDELDSADSVVLVGPGQPGLGGGGGDGASLLSMGTQGLGLSGSVAGGSADADRDGSAAHGIRRRGIHTQDVIDPQIN